jgi:plastocyanin
MAHNMLLFNSEQEAKMIRSIFYTAKLVFVISMLSLSCLAYNSSGYLITDIQPAAANDHAFIGGAAQPEGALDAVVGNLLLTLSNGKILATDLDDGVVYPVDGVDFEVTGITAAGRRLLLSSGNGGTYSAILATPEATTFTVAIGQGGSFSFTPANLTVSPGDTVTWEWKSGTHSTTSGRNCAPDGIWDSGVKSSGAFSHTFDSAGDFPYFCTLHCGLGMVGNITVSASSSLTAVAEATPLSGAAPLEVAFSGSATGGTPPYTYTWDFGDGSPTDNSAQTTHTYVSDGIFNVSFSIDDSSSGNSVDRHITITVGSAPPAPPVISGVSKAGSPFRLFINGSNFHPDIQVFIGTDTVPWAGVKYKDAAQLILKKGAGLKAKFPAGVPVDIMVMNGDGGMAMTTYTR